jgi:hypothetical protein
MIYCFQKESFLLSVATFSPLHVHIAFSLLSCFCGVVHLLHFYVIVGPYEL